MLIDTEGREYLEKATVGTVFLAGYSSRYHGPRMNYLTDVTVVRVTKTQLILSNGERINRKTGDEVTMDVCVDVSSTKERRS